MKKALLILTFVVMISGLCTLQAQIVKKYQVKSGIITFENTMTMGKMVMKMKSVVYFDDYGMKECKETYDMDNSLKESFFSDGKELYLVIPKEKTAYKRGTAYRGTEYRFDWNEIAPSGKAKKIANMTVVGKNCEAFQLEAGGGTNTYAGWSNICLYLGVSQKGLSTINKAVKFEENAKIPAEKFKVPAGYAIK